jgi:hypothetical protein
MLSILSSINSTAFLSSPSSRSDNGADVVVMSIDGRDVDRGRWRSDTDEDKDRRCHYGLGEACISLCTKIIGVESP